MLGFTRNETAVLLFLVTTFVAGMGVWFYRTQWAPLPEISEVTLSTGHESNDRCDIEETEVAEGDSQFFKISLNTAECKDLECLPGVGVALATRIVAYRQQHGEFHSVDELIKVRGIGPKTLERMKPYLKLH